MLTAKKGYLFIFFGLRFCDTAWDRGETHREKKLVNCYIWILDFGFGPLQPHFRVYLISIPCCPSFPHPEAELLSLRFFAV